MKVLLINGSPHEKGCTFTALNEVADTLNKNGIETEIYHIGTKPIAGCIACRKCAQSGKCVFNDGVNEIGARLDEFDGIFWDHPCIMPVPVVKCAHFATDYFLRTLKKWPVN